MADLFAHDFKSLIDDLLTIQQQHRQEVEEEEEEEEDEEEVEGEDEEDDEGNEEIQMNLIFQFATEHQIILNGNLWREKYAQKTSDKDVSSTDFKHELLLLMLNYLKWKSFSDENWEQYLENLAIALPFLDNFSRSDDAREKAFYYFFIVMLRDTVEVGCKEEDIAEIKLITDVLKKANDSITNYLEIIETRRDTKTVFPEVVKILNNILTSIESKDNQISTIIPYLYLDLPERTPPNSRALEMYVKKNKNFLRDCVTHLKGLIPPTFLKVSKKILSQRLDGKVIFKNTLCLNEKIVLVRKSKKRTKIVQAKCLVTLLHEMGHLKMTQFFGKDKHFSSIPERFGGQKIGLEEGDYVEKFFFGGVVNFDKINHRLANIILDERNYTNKKSIQWLREQMKDSLYEEDTSLSESSET